MMIKLWAMALAMCLVPFAAQAAERFEYATATVFDHSYAVQSVKHELTLAQWRTGRLYIWCN